VTAAVNLRRHGAEIGNRRLWAWQTRTLATFFAATVPVEDSGKGHPLLEAARQIVADTAESELIEATDLDRAAAEPQRAPKQSRKHWTPDMPSESKPNPIGSYEKFMSFARRSRRP
jgi:hypothetical protein